jgi:hypothetical protein
VEERAVEVELRAGKREEQQDGAQQIEAAIKEDKREKMRNTGRGGVGISAG